MKMTEVDQKRGGREREQRGEEERGATLLLGGDVREVLVEKEFKMEKEALGS